MKNFFKKIWDSIVSLLSKVPYDKWLNFIGGFVIATFFCIALGMKVCIVPAIAAGFIKEFFDMWTSEEGKFDWWDFAAVCIGGLVPQIFVLLNMWWF